MHSSSNRNQLCSVQLLDAGSNISEQPNHERPGRGRTIRARLGAPESIVTTNLNSQNLKETRTGSPPSRRRPPSLSESETSPMPSGATPAVKWSLLPLPTPTNSEGGSTTAELIDDQESQYSNNYTHVPTSRTSTNPEFPPVHPDRLCKERRNAILNMPSPPVDRTEPDPNDDPFITSPTAPRQQHPSSPISPVTTECGFDLHPNLQSERATSHQSKENERPRRERNEEGQDKDKEKKKSKLIEQRLRTPRDKIRIEQLAKILATAFGPPSSSGKPGDESYWAEMFRGEFIIHVPRPLTKEELRQYYHG